MMELGHLHTFSHIYRHVLRFTHACILVYINLQMCTSVHLHSSTCVYTYKCMLLTCLLRAGIAPVHASRLFLVYKLVSSYHIFVQQTASEKEMEVVSLVIY